MYTIAEARGVSMAQVAPAWVLKSTVVDRPIVGVTKEHHLVDAAAAVDLTLTMTRSPRLLITRGTLGIKEGRQVPWRWRRG